MPKLDQAVNNYLKILEKEVKRNLRAAIKDGTLYEWKGRKIITVKEWISIARVNAYQHKLLQYIPDDYIDGLFFYD